MKIKHDGPFALDNATRTEYGNKRVYGGGGGDSGSSTTTPSIPAELKPLANLYVQQAGQIAQTPFTPYTGQRYADLNATQNLGIGMVQDRALNGSQTMNNAESNLNQFINGGNTNPYLDAMVQKAQGSVLGNSAALARRSGSFGNSGIQEQALRQIGDVATNMYGNAYGQDQSNRLQAIGMAPTYGNAQYQDASQLLNAGNIQQQQAQNNLDFGYNQFQQGQDYPFKQLQATGGVINSNMGSKTTSSGGGK
jgi:hypothetical protein